MTCWILLLATLTTILKRDKIGGVPFIFKEGENLPFHPVSQPSYAIMSVLLLSPPAAGLKSGLHMFMGISWCAVHSAITQCSSSAKQSEAKLPDTWCSSCSWQTSTNCSGSMYGAEAGNAPVCLVPDSVPANLSQAQLTMAPFETATTCTHAVLRLCGVGSRAQVLLCQTSAGFGPPHLVSEQAAVSGMCQSIRTDWSGTSQARAVTPLLHRKHQGPWAGRE